MESQAIIESSVTTGLDPYKSPPNDLKQVFKEWKKFKDGSLLQESNVTFEEEWSVSGDVDLSNKRSILKNFMDPNGATEQPDPIEADMYQAGLASCYESKVVPGLMVFPRFLPSECQVILLDRLINRDLSSPAHKTNLDIHYNIERPKVGKSFLDFDRKSVPFLAKDAIMHSNLSMEQAMMSKLRWMTLGGQYDWTKKRYPEDTPPSFPDDIYHLLHAAFPTMKPQAAIGTFHPATTFYGVQVNFYSPGDTLSLHRDVSEDVDRGLVSVSIGCDAIFIIGLSEGDDLPSRYQAIRLRSGDAVYMTGESRYAWHGVPKIIPGTCPKTLETWPGLSHPQWEGYMETKRINLNVRQMFKS